MCTRETSYRHLITTSTRNLLEAQLFNTNTNHRHRAWASPNNLHLLLHHHLASGTWRERVDKGGAALCSTWFARRFARWPNLLRRKTVRTELEGHNLSEYFWRGHENTHTHTHTHTHNHNASNTKRRAATATTTELFTRTCHAAPTGIEIQSWAAHLVVIKVLAKPISHVMLVIYIKAHGTIFIQLSCESNREERGDGQSKRKELHLWLFLMCFRRSLFAVCSFLYECHIRFIDKREKVKTRSIQKTPSNNLWMNLPWSFFFFMWEETRRLPEERHALSLTCSGCGKLRIRLLLYVQTFLFVDEIIMLARHAWGMTFVVLGAFPAGFLFLCVSLTILRGLQRFDANAPNTQSCEILHLKFSDEIDVQLLWVHGCERGRTRLRLAPWFDQLMLDLGFEEIARGSSEILVWTASHYKVLLVFYFWF